MRQLALRNTCTYPLAAGLHLKRLLPSLRYAGVVAVVVIVISPGLKAALRDPLKRIIVELIN